MANKKRYAMLIDLQRCIGCDTCTLACKQENGTPADVFFARVLNIESGRYPDVRRVYLPVLCNHCSNAPCVRACPNKAIFKREDGIVLIDQDRCKGTGACVTACPYGNIFLTERDKWYLPPDMPYEEYTKRRLKPNVARKCTYCAHRVDEGLDPACVAACPTTARIFGDLEDPQSKISVYLQEQKERTRRDPFQLLDQLNTDPSTRYLEPMNRPETAVIEEDEEAIRKREPVAAADSDEDRPAAKAGLKSVVMILLIALCLLSAQVARGDGSVAAGNVVFHQVGCSGCHGDHAEGNVGPKIAGTRLTEQQVQQTVRSGKGMMPAFSSGQISDQDIQNVYQYLQSLGKTSAVKGSASTPVAAGQPFSIGSLLTTRKVRLAAWIVVLISLFEWIFVLRKWVRWAGIKEVWPYWMRLGIGGMLAALSNGFITESLLVGSLMRRNWVRWIAHGMIIYGFLGLWLADGWISLVNPNRNFMPILSGPKMLANVSGALLITGLLVVVVRLFMDPYENNGITLKADITFIVLLLLVAGSGFATEYTRYHPQLAASAMHIYAFHLTMVFGLLLTAPFTRFAHTVLAPLLLTSTRLTQAVVDRGLAPEFAREPAPGRHHKSARIAEYLMDRLDRGDQPATLRYFP